MEKRKNANAPFLVTLTSNGLDYSESCKWLYRCEGQIHTYNCFLKAKIDLDACIAKHEVPFTLVIAAMLTSTENIIKLSHIDTCKYGETSERERLIDIKIDGSGELSISIQTSLKESFQGITNKLQSYTSPSERFSRLMYDTMQEADKMKSFLFAWTALEVFVNKTFRNLTVTEFPEKDIPDAYRDRVARLFLIQIEGGK